MTTRWASKRPTLSSSLPSQHLGHHAAAQTHDQGSSEGFIGSRGTKGALVAVVLQLVERADAGAALLHDATLLQGPLQGQGLQAAQLHLAHCRRERQGPSGVVSLPAPSPPAVPSPLQESPAWLHLPRAGPQQEWDRGLWCPALTRAHVMFRM